MTNHFSSAIPLIGAVALAAPAHAQNALDANLRVGSGGVNDVVQADSFAFRDEVAFRNAFVTGNVGGLGGFRGDIGYTATDDFRGDLGSNDIFGSLAQSAGTSSAAVATRGVSSLGVLQQSLAFTNGFQTQGITRRPIILQSGAGATAASINTPLEDERSVDVFGQIRGSLRNTAGAIEIESVRPSALAQQQTDDGDVLYAVGSPILGLRLISSDAQIFNPRPRYDFETRDQQQDDDPAAPDQDQTDDSDDPNDAGGPPTLGATRVEPTAAGAARLTGVDRDGANASLFSYQQFEEPARRLGILPAGVIPEPIDPARTVGDEEPGLAADGISPLPDEPEWVSQIRAHMDALRADLTEPALGVRNNLGAEVQQRLATAGQGEDAAPEVGADFQNANLLAPNPLDRAGGADVAPDEDAPAGDADAAVQLLRDAPAQRLTLVTPLDTNAVYREHMTQGEAALRDGRYFVAEERFTAALGARPGDPMAAVGRVAAQFSGGLFRSAALNLRNLYRGYPELIRARFENTLLPTEARAGRLVELLRERVDRDGGGAADAALLLAFLGYQLEDDDVRLDALASMQRLADNVSPADRAVTELVVELWLEDE